MKMAADVERHSLRNSLCDQNMLLRADGSAMFSQGNSTVLVAVYGPGEVKIQKEILDKAHVDVICKPKIGLPGSCEKLNENIIRNSVASVVLTSLYPRTSITIVIQDLQSDGSFLACCINAACLALLDAGIEMKHTFAAVTCAVDSDGDITVDPCKKDEMNAQALLTFALNSNNQSIITLCAVGVFNTGHYESCLNACQTASKEIFSFYRQSTEKKFCKNKD